jgi:2'-5' RNA ligase
MSDDAMIAFLPANAPYVKQDFPHLTLVYAGPITDRDKSEFNVMGKDAISAARAIGGSFSLNVTGVDTLGDAAEEVDVLLMYPTPQLLIARKMVESWNRSEFAEFLPHVTIGPAGSAYTQRDVDTSEFSYSRSSRNVLPNSIFFNRLAVCWGNDRLIFSLSDYDY